MADNHPEPLSWIDLNADVGEASDDMGRATEAGLIGLVSSVNIACGGHAGDDETMRRTIAAAVKYGCAIGAHPSYPDRAGFGRTKMDLPATVLGDGIERQIGRLAEVAASLGVALSHVKPHGALYHAVSEDDAVADAVLRAVRAIDPGLCLYAAAGSRAVERWSAGGVPVVPEAFADRTYEPDGRLRSREVPGAVLDSADATGAQAVSIARDRSVVASDGTRISLVAGTICVHGDTEGAVAMAATVVDRLRAVGIGLRPPRLT